MNNNQFDPAAFLFANLIALTLGWLLFFGLCGGIAAVVAPQGRRWTFFMITLFFLGPMGIGFAAVASPRAPDVDETAQTVFCWRCDARQNVDLDADQFDCWRCETKQDI
jgi:hypothetical protein